MQRAIPGPIKGGEGKEGNQKVDAKIGGKSCHRSALTDLSAEFRQLQTERSPQQVNHLREISLEGTQACCFLKTL